MILKIQTPRSNVGMKEEKKKLKMPSSNSIIVKTAIEANLSEWLDVILNIL